jgi:hypothetical protein
MPTDDRNVREIIKQVCARQSTLAVLQRQELGTFIDILNKHGVTQGQIGVMVGIPQGRVSDYKRGAHKALASVTFKRFADGLDLPEPARQALGVAPRRSDGSATVSAGDVPTDTFDLQLLAEEVGRSGDNVKRREMLSLAARVGAGAAIAQSAVWERLAYALTNPSAMNEAVIREMEARTAGFHRLQEVVPAQALFKALALHIREVSTLLNGGADDPKDQLRTRLIVAAGESSVLAGWTASDTGDSVTARNFYDTAEKAATEVGDPAIAACALAYRSYIPSTKGAHGRSRVLLTTALEAVSEKDSPATVAWIAARHAEESASLGDKAEALKSWGRAAEAFSVADPEDDRIWTRFLDRNRFESYGIATYSRIGKLDEAQETASAVLRRLAQPERKKAAIILEDIATAYLARGSVNEATRVASSGLAVVRETEFAMWLPRFEAIARGLQRWQRQPSVRAYLEEFAMTKRQFASSPR